MLDSYNLREICPEDIMKYYSLLASVIYLDLLPRVSQIFRSTRCLCNHDVLRPYLRQVKLYKQHQCDRSRFRETRCLNAKTLSRLPLRSLKVCVKSLSVRSDAMWSVYTMLLNNDTINMPRQCQHMTILVILFSLPLSLFHFLIYI